MVSRLDGGIPNFLLYGTKMSQYFYCLLPRLLPREPVESKRHMGQNISHPASVIYDTKIYDCTMDLGLSVISTDRQVL